MSTSPANHRPAPIVRSLSRRAQTLALCHALPLCTWLAGCTPLQPTKDPQPSTELELAYDEGPPTDRPLLPPSQFEWLIKFEPNLPAYQTHHLRLLLAQPGALRLALYAVDSAGRPGDLLRALDRTYPPELTSNGQDGKWLIEPLRDLPRQTGALFVGISVPTPGPSAARVWTTATSPVPSPGGRAPTQIYQRDAEAGTAQQSTRLPMVPVVRLALVPAAPPPVAVPPASSPAAKPAPAPAAEPAATPSASSPTPSSPTPSSAAPGRPPAQ